jgi:hypothetical protein
MKMQRIHDFIGGTSITIRRHAEDERELPKWDIVRPSAVAEALLAAHVDALQHISKTT